MGGHAELLSLGLSTVSTALNTSFEGVSVIQPVFEQEAAMNDTDDSMSMYMYVADTTSIKVEEQVRTQEPEREQFREVRSNILGTCEDILFPANALPSSQPAVAVPISGVAHLLEETSAATGGSLVKTADEAARLSLDITHSAPPPDDAPDQGAKFEVGCPPLEQLMVEPAVEVPSIRQCRKTHTVDACSLGMELESETITAAKIPRVYNEAVLFHVNAYPVIPPVIVDAVPLLGTAQPCPVFKAQATKADTELVLLPEVGPELSQTEVGILTSAPREVCIGTEQPMYRSFGSIESGRVQQPSGELNMQTSFERAGVGMPMKTNSLCREHIPHAHNQGLTFSSVQHE